MAEDLLRISIEGEASGASAAIGKVSEEAVGLDAGLKEAGVSGVTAGNQIAEGMKKANYSMLEARHSVMLLGEEVGVKVPRALSGILARSETLGTALAAAFSVVAIPAFVELGTKVVEKLTDLTAQTFIYTDSMKAAEAATATMNTEMVKLEDQLKETEKAMSRVGLSADALARLKFADQLAANLKEVNAALDKANEPLKAQVGWWERIKDAAKDALSGQLIGTTEMLDSAQKYVEIKNNQTQADKAAAEAHKELVAQNALLDAQEADAYKKVQTEALKEVEKANFAFFERQQHAAAEAAKKMDDEIANGLIKLKELSDQTQVKSPIDLAAFADSGVSGFTRSLEDGATAARNYGVTLKTDLITQLANLKKAYQEIQALGPLADASQLKEMSKQITDLDTQIKQFGTDAKASMMTTQEATDSLDDRLNAVLNTNTLMKKGWGEFEAQAVQSLDEIGAALLKHLAIALLTDNMEKLSHAKTAAAGAYEAMAPIPFVGPALGAAAAASVFAGAMAFDQGGLVPEDGSNADTQAVFVKGGEMVLPKPLSDTVQSMAQSATGAGGGGNVHIHAMDSQSFENFLKRNPSALSAGINHASSRGSYSVRKNVRGK